MATTKKAGAGQIIALITVAVVLLVAYLVLDRYSAGQKDMLIVETRGMNMVQGLTRYKLETGNYPDALDKLAPKFAASPAKCPDGQNMAYQLTGGEYTLSCQNIIFKSKPFGYDSRSKAWSG
jgi:hypothetical protein